MSPGISSKIKCSLFNVLYLSVLIEKPSSLKKFYVTNVDTELAVFEQTGKIAVINNSKEPKETDLYVRGQCFAHLELEPMEMRWIEMEGT